MVTSIVYNTDNMDFLTQCDTFVENWTVLTIRVLSAASELFNRSLWEILQQKLTFILSRVLTSKYPIKWIPVVSVRKIFTAPSESKSLLSWDQDSTDKTDLS